ncbi:glycosyltransferase family 4 protein [Flaviflexus ciconiae]
MGSTRNIFGGWLDGMFGQFSDTDGVEVSVAFPLKDPVPAITGDSATYYSFRSGPLGQEPVSGIVDSIRDILSDAQPDIVHVFGTESQHVVTVLRLCQELRIPALLQMQGLMGSITKHFTGWLPDKVTRRATLPERVLKRSTQHHLDNFRAAGELESEALGLAKHVLGHTTYDRAWASQVTPSATYHHAEETLRQVFYGNDRWSPNLCDRYSLLVSQASVPYKGAHIAISAMPIILRSFPDAVLYIAGPNPVGSGSLMQRIRRSGYGWYLSRLIKRCALSDKVKFVGALDQSAMRDRYLQSHVFLSCSSIENESNSVSEAKILGVPVVASYVGGVTDRIRHGVTGFHYQGDAPYMLAHFAMEIFSNDKLALNLGSEARADAVLRHDRQRNLNRILEIYRTVLLSPGYESEVSNGE